MQQVVTGNVTLTVTVTSHSSGSEDRSAVIVFSTGDINVEHAITQQSPGWLLVKI